MNIVCKNCDVHFKGYYCPNCAQKASTTRLKPGNILHEFWHNFTHTDKGIVGLIRLLFINPGKVIREYIEGKRKKYFNPYTFFLIVTALLIYVAGKVFHYEDERYHYNNEFGQYISKHYNIIILLSLPFLAGLLRWIFLRKGYNYAEWVVFFVFAFGIINFIQLLIQLCYFPLVAYHASFNGYTLLLVYIVFIVVLLSFIQPKKIWGWLQCLLAGVLVYFFVERIAKGVALVYWGIPLKKVINAVFS
jgi:Protein of unknown function (DUF3667)